MQTSNTLAIMQSVATLSLMLSLSFAYLINPLEDSLFFSSLDGFTERKIMDAIRNFNKNITLLIVSHRPESLDICNQIYELKNGCINLYKK